MKHSLFFLLIYFCLSLSFSQDFEENYYIFGNSLSSNNAKSFVINEAENEINGFHKKVVWGDYINNSYSQNGFFLYSLDQSGQILKNYRIEINSNIPNIPAFRPSAERIIKTSDGGYIMIGNMGYPNTVIYVLKVDDELNYQWSVTLKNPDMQQEVNIIGKDIIESSSGDFYIVGYTQADNSEVLLLKINDSGVIQQHFTYYISSNNVGISLKETDSGDILITGNTNVRGVEAINILNMCVKKTGSVKWAYVMEPTYNHEGSGNYIVEDPNSNGDFYIGGYLQRIDNTGDFPLKKKNFLLTKIDENGIIDWGKIYGDDNDETCVHISPESVGSNTQLSLTGSTQSFGNGGFDILYIKTDANGNVLNSLTYGGSLNDFGSESQTDGNHHGIVGYRSKVIGGNNTVYSNLIGFKLNAAPLNCAGNPNILDKNVNLRHDELFPIVTDYTLIDNPSNIPIVFPINRFYECGSFFASRLENKSDQTIDEFKVAPNPIKNNYAFLQFSLQEEAALHLKVVNLIGETVYIFPVDLPSQKGTHSLKLNLTSLPSGMYIVVLESEKDKQFQKIVIP